MANGKGLDVIQQMHLLFDIDHQMIIKKVGLGTAGELISTRPTPSMKLP